MKEIVFIISVMEQTVSETACSPSCHLARDTEISAAISPDYRTAFILHLRDFLLFALNYI